MTMTLSAILEAHAVSSGVAMLMLAEFTHPEFTEPLYGVRDTVELTSNSKHYVPFPFDVIPPEESEGSVNRARIVVDPLAMPATPTAVTGESINNGSNTLAQVPLKRGSVDVYANAVLIGTDNGSGTIEAPEIESCTILYDVGLLDVVFTGAVSAPFTVDYEFLSSGDSLLKEVLELNPVNGPIQVSLIVVKQDEPDTIQIQWPTMDVRKITATLTMFEGDLEGFSRLNDSAQSKARRFTPNNFPGLF